MYISCTLHTNIFFFFAFLHVCFIEFRWKNSNKLKIWIRKNWNCSYNTILLKCYKQEIFCNVQNHQCTNNTNNLYSFEQQKKYYDEKKTKEININVKQNNLNIWNKYNKKIIYGKRKWMRRKNTHAGLTNYSLWLLENLYTINSTSNDWKKKCFFFSLITLHLFKQCSHISSTCSYFFSIAFRIFVVQFFKLLGNCSHFSGKIIYTWIEINEIQCLWRRKPNNYSFFCLHQCSQSARIVLNSSEYVK